MGRKMLEQKARRAQIGEFMKEMEIKDFIPNLNSIIVLILNFQ